jgi:hypothetical protein
MSLIVPILIAFLPELLGEAIGFMPGNQPRPAPLSPFLFVGVRFLIAYLITIVTLELALQAQALQSKRKNTWVALLLINLGFDVASILVFQIFKVLLDKTPIDPLMITFFLMCAVPTVLTGVIVVCGSYSALTGGKK